MPSLVFDKYEIIRRLAVGGMGEIFLARQVGIPGFDRLVILKSLLPDYAKDASRVERFLDEARVAAKLNHPNIVAIYEVGLWRGSYFIAMEYISGASVAEILSAVWEDDELEGFPYPVAAHILHDAARALDHAHLAKSPEGKPLGVIHRDISPQNIMVREDGVTKVVDFGIAKAADRYAKTATGKIHGKLSYMSPEQARAEALDPRADQFSLGVVAWEMCAGRRLFSRQDPLETLHTLLYTPARRLSDARSGCPAALDSIVACMLRPRPEDRYPDCGAVAESIRSYLDGASQEYGESAVARFVQEVCGDDIRERITDLTPSGDDFVISLVGGKEERVAAREQPAAGSRRESQQGRAAKPRHRRRVGLVAGLAAVLSLALVLILAVADTGIWRGAEAIDPALTPAASQESALARDTPQTIQSPAILEITSAPSAAVLLAGQVLGETPLTIDSLAPGVEHRLQLKRTGYTAATLSVTLERGMTAQRSITLTRLPRAAKEPLPVKETAGHRQKPPEPARVVTLEDGTLTLRTKPWTQVSVDGRPYGTTPLFKVRMAAGEHTLRLVNRQASIDRVRQIEIPSGDNLRLDLTLEP